MSTATVGPASASEAMDMVHAGLAYLATADATAMGSAAQAACLRGLEQASSVATAAGHSGWVKRARAHPRVQAAMVAKEVSEP